MRKCGCLLQQWYEFYDAFHRSSILGSCCTVQYREGRSFFITVPKKKHTTTNGKSIGGSPFSRATVYKHHTKLLPLYGMAVCMCVPAALNVVRHLVTDEPVLMMKAHHAALLWLRDIFMQIFILMYVCLFVQNRREERGRENLFFCSRNLAEWL